MNYKKHYENLIDTRKLMNRSKKNGIFEKHHIVPKCIGGTNNKENLILLTPKEHYMAHLLLTQMFEGKIKAKMCYALLMMCVNNANQKRIISAKQYEYVKYLISKNCKGENNSFYKKTFSDQVKLDISERMKGDNNPSRKYGVWNKGKKLKSHSEETKEKIKLGNLGKKHSDKTKEKMSLSSKGKVKSEQHRKKLSEINTGKKLSDDTKKKMSLAKKGVKQRKAICPVCGKQGGISIMKRVHFDNCKKSL